jgi:hypothetical protein
VANPNWSLGRIGKKYLKISILWAAFWRKQWEIIQNIEKSLAFDPQMAAGWPPLIKDD